MFYIIILKDELEMISSFTYKITNYIKDNSNIKNINDLEKINYSLQAIFGELFKAIILGTLFLILGKIDYFLLSMIILFSIRIFQGGYHFDTHIKMLIIFSITFLNYIFNGPIAPKLNNKIYYIVALLSIFITIFRTPYPNKKRPSLSKKRKWILKMISTFFTIFW